MNPTGVTVRRMCSPPVSSASGGGGWGESTGQDGSCFLGNTGEWRWAGLMLNEHWTGKQACLTWTGDVEGNTVSPGTISSQ